MRFLRAAVVGVLVSVVVAVGAAAVEVPRGLRPAPSRMAVSAPSQATGHAFGSLRIPAVGVDETIREGVSLAVIDRGVAHWVGTGQPGAAGNVVLAGHRSTHSAPFADLDRLQIGDRIYVAGVDGIEAAYRVGAVFVVTPQDVWITYEYGRPLVTLFACHPKGSATHRIVVQGDLVSVVPFV